MKTGVLAFRFALVGFTLPFMFVLRPQLLMLGSDGAAAPWASVASATLLSALGVLALAAGIAGFLRGRLSLVPRLLAFVAAAMLLFPVSLPVAGTSLPLAALGSVIRTLCAVGHGKKNLAN